MQTGKRHMRLCRYANNAQHLQAAFTSPFGRSGKKSRLAYAGFPSDADDRTAVFKTPIKRIDRGKIGVASDEEPIRRAHYFGSVLVDSIGLLDPAYDRDATLCFEGQIERRYLVRERRRHIQAGLAGDILEWLSACPCVMFVANDSS